MSELQTVEVRFRGSRLGSYVGLAGTVWTLYRVADGYYYVHIDDGGEEASLEAGRNGIGLSDREVRWLCPGLADLLSK